MNRLFLSALTCSCLVACGPDDTNTPSTSSTTSTSASTSSASTSSASTSSTGSGGAGGSISKGGAGGSTGGSTGQAGSAGQGGGSGCPIGFDDCNNDPSDGCETDLSMTATHCGACDHDCSPGACVASWCQPFTVLDATSSPY